MKPFNMLASCHLCIACKRTTNKEQRLGCNERPSLGMKLECPSCLANY